MASGRDARGWRPGPPEGGPSLQVGRGGAPRCLIWIRLSGKAVGRGGGRQSVFPETMTSDHGRNGPWARSGCGFGSRVFRRGGRPQRPGPAPRPASRGINRVPLRLCTPQRSVFCGFLKLGGRQKGNSSPVRAISRRRPIFMGLFEAIRTRRLRFDLSSFGRRSGIPTKAV